jgi:hypothetical protein
MPRLYQGIWRYCAVFEKWRKRVSNRFTRMWRYRAPILIFNTEQIKNTARQRHIRKKSNGSRQRPFRERLPARLRLRHFQILRDIATSVICLDSPPLLSYTLDLTR